MTVFNEQRFTGEFIYSEAKGYRSRGAGLVDGGADGLEPGTLLGKVTATGTYVRHSASANDGSETVAAILLIPARENEVAEKSLILRDAEVTRLHLFYEVGADAAAEAAANAQLDALGIIVRESGVIIK